jgi:hypothetical protein
MSQDEIPPPSNRLVASILQQLIIQSINKLPQSWSLTKLSPTGFSISINSLIGSLDVQKTGINIIREMMKYLSSGNHERNGCGWCRQFEFTIPNL